jgi:Putative stress-induced transcription regulator
MGSALPPRTADGGAFRFRAGRPSLDLCATLLWRYRDPVEQLRRPHNLARWLSDAGLCDRQAVATEDDLNRARSLREAAYRLFQAHLREDPFPAADIASVNAASRHPGPAPELTTRSQIRCSWTHRGQAPGAGARRTGAATASMSETIAPGSPMGEFGQARIP